MTKKVVDVEKKRLELAEKRKALTLFRSPIATLRCDSLSTFSVATRRRRWLVVVGVILPSFRSRATLLLQELCPRRV